MNNEHGVSIVITTVERPKELQRAIESVRKQNYNPYEIVVVVDGGSLVTLNILKQYSDIKVITNVPSRGGQASRNIGITNSKYSYIALLDDDDEWLPDKLLEQMSIVDNNVIFTSLYTYVTDPSKKYILPRTKYNGDVNVADYLFSLKRGRWNGWIQTSTILAPKEIFLRFPFDEKIKKHQDWDWILKISDAGVPIGHVDRPLVIYHKNFNGKKSVSQTSGWLMSKHWLSKWESRMSKATRKDFYLAVIVNNISKDGNLNKAGKLKLIISYMITERLFTKIFTSGFWRFQLQYCFNIFIRNWYFNIYKKDKNI